MGCGVFSVQFQFVYADCRILSMKKGLGIPSPFEFLARQEGIEPSAGDLEGHYSIQLSYWRILD